MAGLTCTGALIHVLYLDLGLAKVSTDNPSSVIIILALCIHLIGTITLIAGLILIRDDAVIQLVKQHPVLSAILLVFLLF
jgi:hypothetical protein